MESLKVEELYQYDLGVIGIFLVMDITEKIWRHLTNDTPGLK